MIRLVLFLAATVIGLYAAMAVIGSGDQRSARSPVVTAPVQPAAEDNGPVATPAADESSQTEDEEPEVVQAAGQTPQQVQRFPGPPLRPSPEHAGRAPEETTAAPAGATGPVRYVTGSRVNMRAGPSTGDRVIGALDGGAAVEALGPEDGPWVNIRDARGRLGYVSAQFLSDTPPR